MSATHGVTNHIIDLLFTASAYATITLNTSIEVHCHRWMRKVIANFFTAKRFEFGTYRYIHARSPSTELAMLMLFLFFFRVAYPLKAFIRHIGEKHL